MERLNCPEPPTNIPLAQVLESKLVEHIHVPEIKPELKLITILGACRTGTGAALTTIADGVDIFSPQALKTIAWRLMAELDFPLTTPLKMLKDTVEINSNLKTHLHKETFGPDLTPANFINPISIWLKKGIPTQNIIVIPTTRTILDTAASWQRMWQFKNGFPIETFNQSFIWTLKLVNWAKSIGIQITPINFDLGKNFSANQIFSSVFKNLNLPFHHKKTTTWKDDRYFQGENFAEPPKKFVKGQLSKDSGGRGGWRWRQIDVNKYLSTKQQQHILENTQPAQQVHEQLASESAHILGLNP